MERTRFIFHQLTPFFDLICLAVIVHMTLRIPPAPRAAPRNPPRLRGEISNAVEWKLHLANANLFSQLRLRRIVITSRIANPGNAPLSVF